MTEEQINFVIVYGQFFPHVSGGFSNNEYASLNRYLSKEQHPRR